MLTFADARVFLNPAPVAPRQPVLPVALVGHVPGAARPERLSRALREPWHGLGLQQRGGIQQRVQRIGQAHAAGIAHHAAGALQRGGHVGAQRLGRLLPFVERDAVGHDGELLQVQTA